MTLAEFLSGEGKAPRGGTTDWLRFCTLQVTSGVLWAGDPYVVGDGCVVKVTPGKCVVQALATSRRRRRMVARLIVQLAAAKSWSLGKEVGKAGTDSAMIGVCDLKAYTAAVKRVGTDEAVKAIEAHAKRGFGIARLDRNPGSTMPFIPTGSDGTGPVYPLISGGKRVGISLDFTGEEDPATEGREVSLIGRDEPDFRTWPLAGGGEAACWVGGDFKAGKNVHIWCDAPRGPVLVRIRQGKSVAHDWEPLKRKRGGGARFGTVKRLQPGNYEIDFRVGEETFSAVRFEVKRAAD